MSAAEIVAYDFTTRRLFVVSGADNRVDFIDITNPAAPVSASSINLAAYGAQGNSVAVKRGVVAVEASPKTNPARPSSSTRAALSSLKSPLAHFPIC